MSTITLLWSLTLITWVYTSYLSVICNTGWDMVKNWFFNNGGTIICIKPMRGTFCWLVNIANRFLHIFSDLVIPIKSIFHRVHGTPLFRLDYLFYALLPFPTNLIHIKVRKKIWFVFEIFNVQPFSAIWFEIQKSCRWIPFIYFLRPVTVCPIMWILFEWA